VISFKSLEAHLSCGVDDELAVRVNCEAADLRAVRLSEGRCRSLEQ
jgi:hypothetical protein